MCAVATRSRDLTPEAPPLVTLMPEDLAGVAEELTTYHAHFAPLFARREQREWAAVYLRGLLLTDVPRKNVEAMALRLLGAGPEAARHVRALQQFIGEGAWDDMAILAAHRHLVEETLGEEDGVLIVDGSDVPKRGRHSVGVAPQWCGATGKTDNCQAGVYLGYASRKGYTLLDRRLYLPAPWFAPESRDRWQASAIPTTVTFQTKADLAAEMVTHVREEQHLRARWLTCDEWYGRNATFLDQVAATGLSYLAEVPHDTQVWPLRDPARQAARARPQVWVPPRTASGKGRRPTRARVHPDSPPPLRVDDLASQLPADRWYRYRILEGSKGPLVADFAAVRAVATRDGLPGPEVWVLVRRPVRNPADAADPPELKICLSNAPAETPLAELVRVSGLRWPIESCFEESKGELGLDHYELRFWRGWHHHMTLVILAHHFLVRLQQRLGPREGGQPAVSRALHHRVARRLPRAGGLPGRRRRVVPPDTDAAASPELGRGALAAARRAPPAPARRPRSTRSAQLPTSAQDGRLPLPSPPHPASA
jgi:SRSO17 transposase